MNTGKKSSATQIIKRLGGYPCSHRQWKDDGHCQFLHGSDRWIEITWQGERDERGWVVDFGALKGLKEIFEHQIFNTELRVTPEEHKILITEPPNNPKKNREDMVELM